ncbi:unnamed protein product [Peronospora belbahrii]|uniref:Reverse transcriptase Ty1/copia-type domain-containing protein n=1 Tax=Peronospora belbahrii TaxID=622444 RepID=A0AAU9KNK8_9STRA|nr:unnamed protein product [Peronospora belbahrii]CAH0517718.1 unnamed protein product [Peronospora belbahrii]
MQSNPCRFLIGCLQYIAIGTRLDVAYVVTQLSRFLENPGQQHSKAVIRALSYLRTTKDYGITNDGIASEVQTAAYTDADWGSNIDNRLSYSAEAEYTAISLCTQEVLWVRAMLKDLGHKRVGDTLIWKDNQGAIGLANNAGCNARTMHVDICHQFIRKNEYQAINISIEDYLADMLTNALETNLPKYSLYEVV